MKRLQSLRHLLLALPLLAALLCTSCQRHSAVWPQLLEAEALLDTDLPAAASLLDSLDATPLRGEDAALYAILKTQADYKRYVPLTSDSLPRLATAYYGTPYRKNYHAAMAWYSLGCYYTEKYDDPAAIESYLRAKDLYPDTLVRYYALCEQNLGKHYLSQHMHKDALEYFELCKNHPVCTSDSLLLSYQDYFSGLALLRMYDYKGAESSFLAVSANPSAELAFKKDINYQLARIRYYGDKDTGQAQTYLNSYFREMKNAPLPAAALLLMGEIYLDRQVPDSAACYYRKCLEMPADMFTRCHACRQLLSIGYSQDSDASSDDNLFENYVALRDSVSDHECQTTINEIEKTHEAVIHARELRRKRNILFVALSTCLILIGLFHLIRKKRQLQSEVNFHRLISQSREQELDSLTEESVKAHSSLPTQETIRRIELCRRRFSELGYKHKLSSWNAAGKISAATLKEYNSAISLLTSDFRWDLSQACPELSKLDLLYCACVILELPDNVFAALSGSTDRALVSRRYRIKKTLPEAWKQLLFANEAQNP